MKLTRAEIIDGVNSSLLDWLEGPRKISSAFRLRCDSCGSLVDRGLAVGSPCPFYVAKGARCGGVLRENPTYKL